MTEHDVVRDQMLTLLDFLRDLSDGKKITLTGAQVNNWIYILEVLDCLLQHLDTKE